MVDHIQAGGTNPLNSALTQALGQPNATEKAGVAHNAQKAYGRELNDGSTNTQISNKALALSKALQFVRMGAQNAEDVLPNPRVAELKALYEAGGPESLNSLYSDTDLAESIMRDNSPVAAFLR